MGSEIRTCKLILPCKEGHDSQPSLVDRYGAKKPIGKYYFTEEALRHDLAALKRGEIYGRDEFYKRAKAWYKAEIDRLLHLKQREEQKSRSQTQPEGAAPKNNTISNETPERLHTTTPQTTAARPKYKAKSVAPTRIQPARAAKRKASEPPPRRKKKAQTPTSEARITESAGPNLVHCIQTEIETRLPTEPESESQTKGDYALSAHDWAQFRNGNQGEHHPSPWSYVRLQGLDVAYFCMRVERAVGAKIADLAAAAAAAYSGDGDGDGTVEEGRRPEAGGTRRSHKLPKIEIRRNTRCALGYRYEKPAPFVPAAALAPGEDWRPPVTSTPPLPATTTTSTVKATPTAVSPSSWAADEVNRRDEINRKAVQVAPEAEMEISPTLGRWNSQHRQHAAVGLESGTETGLVPMAGDLGAGVVEVSGLRFVVDLCLCRSRTGGEAGVEEGARFLML